MCWGLYTYTALLRVIHLYTNTFLLRVIHLYTIHIHLHNYYTHTLYTIHSYADRGEGELGWEGEGRGGVAFEGMLYTIHAGLSRPVVPEPILVPWPKIFCIHFVLAIFISHIIWFFGQNSLDTPAIQYACHLML